MGEAHPGRFVDGIRHLVAHRDRSGPGGGVASRIVPEGPPAFCRTCRSVEFVAFICALKYHSRIMKISTCTPSETAAMTLIEIADLIERRLDREISFRRGISFREFRILKSLSRFPQAGAMRVDLAAEVGLTPSAITRALKPLEKIGVVTSIRSERDSRSSLARLTDAGREMLADAQAIVDDALADMPIEHIPGAALDELHAALLATRRPAAS
ncbi:MarR family transcriptional regulator [Halomonas denitrificans]|nr:MarR family transcriptional regulator [Halomonas denitrificans]